MFVMASPQTPTVLPRDVRGTSGRGPASAGSFHPPRSARNGRCCPRAGRDAGTSVPGRRPRRGLPLRGRRGRLIVALTIAFEHSTDRLHGERNVRRDVLADAHEHGVLPDLLDRLLQLDAAAVDVESLFDDGTVYVNVRHRSEQLAAAARAGLDLDLQASQSLGQPLVGSALALLLDFDQAFLVLEAREASTIGGHRQPLGEKVVARVARLHLDDVADDAERRHVFSQDHFHVAVSCPPAQPAEYGSRAALRARLIAIVRLRWCFAHVPVVRLGTMRPRSLTNVSSTSDHL
jgi:hypothetical protein